jgi:hypothetical protein
MAEPLREANRDRADSRRPKRASRRFRLFGSECYCGLGPACALFREMTPAQRIECSLELRRANQAYFRNGMG